MRRLTEQVWWYLTALTLAALVLIAIVSSYATSSYADSMKWVSHSYQVKADIGEIRSGIFAARNGRLLYVFAGQQEGSQQFRAVEDSLPEQIEQLRKLTANNPVQQSRVAELVPLTQHLLNAIRISMEMKSANGSMELQAEYSANIGDLARATFGKLESLREEEQRVLGVRTVISEKTYRRQNIVLAISLALVLFFIILNFVELVIQLRQRKTAELVVRRLSGRILQVQDEERRKLARDLHDGIGQLFTALKMSLAQAARSQSNSQENPQALSECLHLVDEGLTQCRTLSYLLHPPLLDEVGFPAAARWLVDGFSKRSKISVSLEMPGALMLPKEMELTLFRVLQEALTNIHRHSGSNRSEVVVSSTSSAVVMTVKDFGKGIPEPTLENFKTSKAPAGVGLAGMRGRVADFNGTLDLESAGQGTIVRVSIPFLYPLQAAAASSSPPNLDGAQQASTPARDAIA